MQREVYEVNDLILPYLTLPNPCNVRVAIYADHVSLFVGPRDWSWDRKTGVLLGSGMDVKKKCQ
jgi:hypothetical protein